MAVQGLIVGWDEKITERKLLLDYCLKSGKVKIKVMTARLTRHVSDSTYKVELMGLGHWIWHQGIGKILG